VFLDMMRLGMEIEFSEGLFFVGFGWLLARLFMALNGMNDVRVHVFFHLVGCEIVKTHFPLSIDDYYIR
jgi:hypothetical protein